MGKLEDIALGESIYAVRFIGTRAYMVTFQSIDPLFVIDLSSPRSPKVLGELSIPGYSNYLQPYDATHLIGFGNEVDASIDKDKVHTPGAVYYTAVQGLKLALFDVSDVTHPVEMAKTVIGDRGSTSPLLTDHHALLFEKDTGLLAFPVLVYQNTPGQAADQQGRPVFQGAYVYNVSLQGGFKFRGQISQYDSDAYVKAGNYWFDQGKDVQRIVRISDALFTVSDGEVMSSDLSTLAKENTVAFPASHSPSPCGDFAPCPMPLAQ